MKKICIIIFSTIIFANISIADEPRIFYKDKNKVHVAHKTHFMDWHTD